MKGTRLPLTVAALGIVFGDIGTSPLYAFRQAVLAAPDQLAPSVLGVLSLVLWAIVLSVAVKYVGLVLRLNNDGEGGILALATLLGLHRRATHPSRFLIAVALIGAAMLFGDGVITPAISVLAAVEGLEVAVPRLADWDVPITVAVLLGLYASQRAGTHRIAALFGPVMIVWFATIAALGAVALVSHPAVLLAVNPAHGLSLLATQPAYAGAIVGAVFLAITGGEALYADLGQFGRPVIARAWFTIAMPALVLNYFGQGALILSSPSAIKSPFYLLAPGALQLPLLVLAAAATVIASQAVITGVFSLAHQAIKTGFLVPLKVAHTATDNERDVYVGVINTLLAVFSIFTVLYFRSSDALATAYGLAVAAAMVTTTILFLVAQVALGLWPRPLAVVVGAGLLCLDFGFVVANLGKLGSGGWLPVTLAGGAILSMVAWRHGTSRLLSVVGQRAHDLVEEARRLGKQAPNVDRTVILLSSDPNQVPPALSRLEDLFGLTFAHTVVLYVRVIGRPRADPATRLQVNRHGPRLLAITVSVGYMQAINLPSLIAPALHEADLDPNAAVYAIGYERALGPRRIRSFADVLSWIFVFLQRNSVRIADRFQLPPRRTLEISDRVDLASARPAGNAGSR